jgi:hypothetical protein
MTLSLLPRAARLCAAIRSRRHALAERGYLCDAHCEASEWGALRELATLVPVTNAYESGVGSCAGPALCADPCGLRHSRHTVASAGGQTRLP